MPMPRTALVGSGLISSWCTTTIVVCVVSLQRWLLRLWSISEIVTVGRFRNWFLTVVVMAFEQTILLFRPGVPPTLEMITSGLWLSRLASVRRM